MSETQAPSWSVWRARTPAGWALRGVLGTLLTLLLVLGGLLVFLATPAGRGFVEARLDGLSLSRGLVLEIEGLEGNVLSQVRLASVRVRDRDGVWLQAQDLSLAWHPVRLMGRTLAVDRLSIKTMTVARRPMLEERRETARRSSGGGWGVVLNQGSLAALRLEEPVVGVAGTFALSASGERPRSGPTTARLSAERLDAPGDALLFTLSEGAAFTLAFNAAADGPSAALIGVPGQALALDARGALGGDVRVSLDVDGARAASFAGTVEPAAAGGVWTMALSGTGWLDVARVERAAPLAERLGGRVEITAIADPAGQRLRVSAPSLEFEVRQADAAIPIAITRADLATLSGGIVGAERARGDVTVRPPRTPDAPWTLEANARAEGMGLAAAPDIAFDADVTAFTGQWPLQVVGLEATVTPRRLAPNLSDFVGRPLDLRAEARRTTAGWRAEMAAAGPGGLTLEGQGRWAGGLAVSGAVRADVPTLKAEAFNGLRSAAGLTDLAGTLTATVTAEPGDAAQSVAVQVDIAGADLRFGQDTLDAVVGETPRLTGEATLSETQLIVSRVRARLAGMDVEADGTAERAAGEAGWADARINLGSDLAFNLDTLAAAPLGPVVPSGAAMGRLDVQGTLSAPTARFQLDADQVDAFGRSVRDARARVELSRWTGARAEGLVSLDARHVGDGVETDALSASAGWVWSPQAAVLQDITLAGLGVSAQGRAERSSEGAVQAAAQFSYPARALTGSLDITQAAGGLSPRLDVTVRAGPQTLGGVDVSTLEATLAGTLEDLRYRIDVQGVLEAAPVALALSGDVAETDGVRTASLSPEGTLGPFAVTSPSPLRVRLDPRGPEPLRAEGVLGIDAGTLTLTASQSADTEAFDVTLDLQSVPLSLVRLLQPDATLEGSLDGALALEGVERLVGRLRLQTRNARVGQERSEGVDGVLDVNFGEALDATLNLAAREDADASGRASEDDRFVQGTASLRAPVQLVPRPPFVVVDRQAGQSGVADVTVDLAALARAGGMPDAASAGQLVIDVSSSGPLANPEVSGALTVREGALYEAVSGVQAQDLEARVTLTGDEARLERLTARDVDGGRITGTGSLVRSEAGWGGGVDITLERFRVVDINTARGLASGTVRVERPAGAAPELGGTLRIDQADIALGGGGGQNAVRPPTMEVVELNRPEDLRPPPGPRAPPVGLDLTLEGPRRIFVRGQGLESEWGLDARLAGDLNALEVYGEARLITGQVTFAATRFDLTEGVITLNGDPSDAQVTLVASRDTGTITARIALSGPVSDPTIRLESTPSLPEDEVLSQVLFGRASGQLSAFETAQLAAALAQLAGGGGGVGLDLLGDLRRGLGLDRLQVGGEEGGVSGGKYIDDDVYVSVGASAGAGATVAIEWTLAPRVELVSRFTSTQSTSVVLRWRRDY